MRKSVNYIMNFQCHNLLWYFQNAYWNNHFFLIFITILLIILTFLFFVELDSRGSRQGLVVGSCEQSSESLGFIKGWHSTMFHGVNIISCKFKTSIMSGHKVPIYEYFRPLFYLIQMHVIYFTCPRKNWIHHTFLSPLFSMSHPQGHHWNITAISLLFPTISLVMADWWWFWIQLISQVVPRIWVSRVPWFSFKSQVYRRKVHIVARLHLFCCHHR
jgi:hypothetical protein